MEIDRASGLNYIIPPLRAGAFFRAYTATTAARHSRITLRKLREKKPCEQNFFVFSCT